MRSRTLVIGALVAGCHSSSPASSASPASTGTPAAATPAKPAANPTPPPAAASHPMPAAAVEKLRAYGAPHGTPIYVPPMAGDVEHWLAFVGGDAAMSGWLVTPSDPAHLLASISEWPTGLRVDGAYFEATPHGFPHAEHETYAWLLVTSLPGMGQPGGVHGVLHVEINAPNVTAGVGKLENLIVPLAGVTRADDIAHRLDPLAAEEDRTMALVGDADAEKLAATLGNAAAPAADLTALIPKGGAGVANVWQDLFVQPTGRAGTADELRPLVAHQSWHCDFVSCTGSGTTAVLGSEDGRVVIRDLLVAASAPPAKEPAPGVRRPVVASPTTATIERTMREQGMLDARVLGEAPYGDHGTIGVVVRGHDGSLVVRDGSYVVSSIARATDATTPAMVRFLDVDGDGRTDAAIAGAEENGQPFFVFDSATVPFGHDLPAGLAAIGATDLDDAIARAFALPERPITSAQACAVLRPIKNAKSLKKASGGHAIVLGFGEPFEPEFGHTDLGKDAPRAIHDVVGRECDLSCDATRPMCGWITDGPEADYFLFRWNGDQLELAVAMIYTGA